MFSVDSFQVTAYIICGSVCWFGRLTWDKLMTWSGFTPPVTQ